MHRHALLAGMVLTMAACSNSTSEPGGASSSSTSGSGPAASSSSSSSSSSSGASSSSSSGGGTGWHCGEGNGAQGNGVCDCWTVAVTNYNASTCTGAYSCCGTVSYDGGATECFCSNAAKCDVSPSETKVARCPP